MPDEAIKQIERFHDSYKDLQEVQVELNQIAIVCYTTGNYLLSETLMHMSINLGEKAIIMRDAFTYMSNQ